MILRSAYKKRICDVCCLTPLHRLPDRSQGLHEGHCHPEGTQLWISPKQDNSIPQMCQSNYRLMLLCMETDTLGYKGTLACVHVNNQTHINTYTCTPLSSELCSLAKDLGMLTCLSENKLALPSVAFFPRRVDACKSHKYIVYMCVC